MPGDGRYYGHDMSIAPLAQYHCVCGEGPIWHATEKALYWLDIPTGRLFRYDPATGEHRNVYTAEFIGAVLVQRDDSLLMLGQGCEVLVYRDGVTTPVIEGIPGETRFNDAIADPEGRVFSGSMPTDAPDGDGAFNDGKWSRMGKLYRIETDGSYAVVDEGFGCSNGLGFTADCKQMYFTDSYVGTIYLYDYDRVTGAVSNRRAFFASKDVVPDGMALDTEGHVWSAHWGGSCFAKHDRDTGAVVQEVTLPTENITSVCFGGEDLETIYITSAGGDPKHPGDTPAGALFATKVPGVRGVAEFRSAVGLG